MPLSNLLDQTMTKKTHPGIAEKPSLSRPRTDKAQNRAINLAAYTAAQHQHICLLYGQLIPLYGSLNYDITPAVIKSPSAR